MALLGIPLPDTGRLRLDAGAPELRLDELALERELEPGRPVRLIDRGAGVVASGVADPENGVVRIYSREDVRSFDLPFFKRRVSEALALRRAVGLAGRSDEAYRLINEGGDALPGLTADVYGTHLVITVPGRGLLPFGRLLGEAALAIASDGSGFACTGVVIKVRGKDPQDRSAKEEILGEAPAAKLIVNELGVPFEIHPLGSLNVGLFTDMREHRRNIARFTAGRRVLNTFAYTGALSVAAARAGASAVTSVDLSGALAWAKENFRLSGLDPAAPQYKFETSDTRRYFERAREEGLTFDTIILDPPTVSAARASQWSMKKDYPDVIALATKLLPRQGGVLWISGNPRRGPGVLVHAIEGIRRAGRRAALLELGGLPPDYPTPPAWTEARYLEVCLLHVLGE